MGWVMNAPPQVNAESQYPTIVAICSILTTLSATIVVTRLCIRHHARGLAKDDWMAILSQVFVMVYAALCVAQTRYGLGLPIKSRPEADLEIYTKLNFAGRPIYQLGISFFKLALLISYLRLLEGTVHKTYRLIVWITIVVILLGHVGCALSLIFACNPVEKSWNPHLEGTCLAAGKSFTGYAIVTIVSDIAVTLIPLPILLKLKIRLEKKLGLGGIFILGLFTTICSILRYFQINRIQYGDGNSTMLVLWGVIEFNVGNIVSSLPFLAPVFIRKAKEYRSKQSGNSSCSSQRYRSNKSSQSERSDSIQKPRCLFPMSRCKPRHFTDHLTTIAGQNIRRSDSEEIILHNNTIPNHGLYNMQIEDEDEEFEAYQRV